MSVLPEEIRAAIALTLGPVTEILPLRGGDISQVARIRARQTWCVVKWRRGASPDFFATEAGGLHYLRAADALRVPDVLMVSHAPAFLVLEYIPTHSPSDEHAFTKRFAEGLAALHRRCEPQGRFGLEQDNMLGAQPQPNGWMARWPDFYRERRLLPQIRKAQTQNLLPDSRARLLAQVVERLDMLLDFDAPSVLLHGDLWSGNFLAAADNEPVLIDPAVYYGVREVELAFVELFGGFPSSFVSAYQAVAPLDAGYARRRPLHQLYPLLVHLNHFGESYGPRVDHACQASLAKNIP